MPYPRIQIKGRLTGDPEIRYTNSGKALCKLNVACNRKQHNPQTNQWEDKGDPVFLNVNMWGEKAETIAEQTHKGTQVLITGELEPNNWVDQKTGNQVRAFQVNAETVALIPQWQGKNQTPTQGWNDPQDNQAWTQPQTDQWTQPPQNQQHLTGQHDETPPF